MHSELRLNKMRLYFLSFLLLLCIYVCRSQRPYDYTEVIRLSNIFYKIQRQGRLPDNCIPWRGDCFLDDGADVGEDLSGGHANSGDFTKFLFPYAAFTTMLNWGILDWYNGYDPSVLEDAYATVRHSLEYLVRMHPSFEVIYGQIGDPNEGNNVWDRCEDWTLGPRTTYQINATAPGSDLAGEFAAAFASGFLIFNTRDREFADILLQHAVSAYEFAYNFRARYSDSIPQARGFYDSWNGYGDELGWAAMWLLRATWNPLYKTRLDDLWDSQGFEWATPTVFNWDDKFAGLFVLGNHVLNEQGMGEDRYRDKAIEYCYRVLNMPRTPLGLTYISEWGTLRHVANAAFACITLSFQDNIDRTVGLEFRTWARIQLHYILGDSGRSYVIGFGQNSPRNPHHRSSSCFHMPCNCTTNPLPCGWNFFNGNQNNHNILTGALVGGPDINDNHDDRRQNNQQNRVSLDYNAGLQSSMAALHETTLLGEI